KLAYTASAANKLTVENLYNHSITTPYNHMWSRQGYVALEWDTVRTEGQPDAYVPRYGAWSATRDDTNDVAMNMPDHVPTTDTRSHSLIGVWTHQRSSNTVWSTRAALQRFDTRVSVGRQQPWEY